MHFASAAPYSECKEMMPALGRVDTDRTVVNTESAAQARAELPDWSPRSQAATTSFKPGSQVQWARKAL